MEKKVEFSLSMLFFWVLGSVSVDSRFVKVSKSNTILGIIPAEKDNQSIPLKNISSSMISSQYRTKPIIIGLIIVFIALNSIPNSFISGIIMLLIGVGVLESGIRNVLVIQRSGSNYAVAVPFYEKSKLVSIQDGITDALAYDTDKTDLNQFFVKKES